MKKIMGIIFVACISVTFSVAETISSTIEYINVVNATSKVKIKFHDDTNSITCDLVTILANDMMKEQLSLALTALTTGKKLQVNVDGECKAVDDNYGLIIHN